MSRYDDEHGGSPFDGIHRQPHKRADDTAAFPSAPSEGAFPPDGPVDLAAVQADDALLDVLGGVHPSQVGSDAELARVLVAWRRDVESDPIRELVDTDTALEVISAARRPPRRRRHMFSPIAAAAAVLVIMLTGVGLGAKSAEPGDQLFGLTKVLYADYARSVEAAEEVQAKLKEAEKAIVLGKTSEAQESLNLVQERLPVVDEAEGRAQLANQRDHLKEMLEKAEPSSRPSWPSSPPETTTTEAPVPSTSPSAPVTSTTVVVVPTTTSTEPVPGPSTPPTVPTSTVPHVPPNEPTPRASPETSSQPAPRADPERSNTAQPVTG